MLKFLNRNGEEMFQTTSIGVFILFLTCAGIRCQSGEVVDQESSGDDSYQYRSHAARYWIQRKRLHIECRYGQRYHLLIGDRISPIRFRRVQEFLHSFLPIHTTDFNPRILEGGTICPPGFKYVRLARSCYRLVYEELNWTSADQRCRELYPRAHLVAIKVAYESNGLKAYLRRELSRESSKVNLCKSTDGWDKLLWTSGQRLNDTSCTEPFAWKISNETQKPLSYSNWNRDEPNCVGNEERCIQVNPRHDFRWNDVNCAEMLCPICEYDPL